MRFALLLLPLACVHVSTQQLHVLPWMTHEITRSKLKTGIKMSLGEPGGGDGSILEGYSEALSWSDARGRGHGVDGERFVIWELEGPRALVVAYQKSRYGIHLIDHEAGSDSELLSNDGGAHLESPFLACGSEHVYLALHSAQEHELTVLELDRTGREVARTRWTNEGGYRVIGTSQGRLLVVSEGPPTRPLNDQRHEVWAIRDGAREVVLRGTRGDGELQRFWAEHRDTCRPPLPLAEDRAAPAPPATGKYSFP